MAKFDKTGDGKLNRKEFGSCIEALKFANSKEGRAKAKKKAQALKAAFAFFDKDKSKTLTIDEIAGILSNPLGGVPYTREEATAILTRYDKNGDGVLNYDEFVDWWTGAPSAEYDPKAVEEALAEQRRLDAEAKTRMVEEALSNERSRLSVGRIELEFWEKQAELSCWKVPFLRDLSRMPFLPPGMTGMDCAIARARSMGKTPLLLDTTDKKIVDAHIMKLDHLQALDAKNMFLDEKWARRTHKQVMGDTRALLVEAMRDGLLFYIRLEAAVVDFANGNYTGEDTFPLAIFDQSEVSDLKRYTGPDGLDLWESPNAFSKVLRHNDLDRNGAFRLQPGFGVLICTHISRAEYKESLELSLSLPKCQAIEITTKPAGHE